MSSDNAAMEAALLEIAKDLLQASDDLASTDPSASAKLAHEAYEIGRDLGIVRNHLDDATSYSDAANGAVEQAASVGFETVDVASRKSRYQPRKGEDDTDTDLMRILDRQKAMLPKAIEISPVKTPSRNTRPMTFESAPARRSSWFGWMRPREWRHAG